MADLRRVTCHCSRTSCVSCHQEERQELVGLDLALEESCSPCSFVGAERVGDYQHGALALVLAGPCWPVSSGRASRPRRVEPLG